MNKYANITLFTIHVLAFYGLRICAHEQVDSIFLEDSKLIHAIKTSNDSVIYRNRLDAHVLNRVYRNKTPLMIALDCLGTQIVCSEKRYNQNKNGEYKNIVGPALFTLATGSMCAYVYSTEPNKDELFWFRTINEIFENPIAIPATMFFGGLIWLLPDLYHNAKILYYKLIARNAIHIHAIKSQLKIVYYMINHPGIDLAVTTKDGITALDVVNKWQETVTTDKYKTILYDLEQNILEKMHEASPQDS